MNGKHNNRKHMTRGKLALLLISLVLVTALGVGGTLAYLFTGTNSVVNTFTPASNAASIDEPDWDEGDTVKKNVTVKNTGDVKSYIRVKIVANWQQEDGVVITPAPVLGADYTMTTNNTEWTLHTDGYYYHKGAVEPKESTAVLIYSAAPVAGRAPAGCTLQIEVLAQAVQAEPASAVANAWGADVPVN